MTKSNDDICPVCGRFTIDCGSVSCFEKERLMRTNAKSDEAAIIKYFGGRLQMHATLQDAKDWLPKAEWEDIETYVLAKHFESISAKCAKHEEIISYLPKVPTQPYEGELAIKCAKYEAALNRIVGMVEIWTDEHGQRKVEAIYASRMAKEALE